MSKRGNSRVTLGIVAAVIIFLPAFHAGWSQDPPPLTLDIYDVQYTTHPGGSSPYRWQTVEIEGVVTANFLEGFTIADGPGAWNSVYVFTDTYAPSLGSRVVLTGLVYEYYGMTTIINVSDLEVLEMGLTVPATVLTPYEVYQEAHESVLVQVVGVQVIALLSYGEWVVADSSGFALVDDLNDYVYFPAVNDLIGSLTGIVFYSFGDFKIEPRDTADVVATALPHYLVHGTVVTMNDAREVLPDSYVEVQGDLIVAIHDADPGGLAVIEAGGLIFPGLIDSHNHPFYNALDVIPFGTTFEDRYEWQATPLYDLFSDQYWGIYHYGGWYEQEANLAKIAELRALTAGTTTMQGINCNGTYDPPFAHQGLVIDNAERFPSRILSSVRPLEVPLTEWAEIASQNWQRFAIHLSEGVNAAALGEFYAVASSGLLDWRTTIIHGVPLGASEWSLMSTAGANLVWSPMSNWTLYGATADVPGALAAGVNVALAPDWTPSGSGNLLAEMQFAAGYDEVFWGDAIMPLQHVEQVTRNAALALANEERLGQIAPGFRANLMVVSGDPEAPYEALLAANPGTVMLTVVSGRPMYGDPGLADALWPMFETEEAEICGTPKLFSITVDSPSIDESGKTVEQIVSELTDAYVGTEPKISDLLLLDDTTSPRQLLEGPVCVRWGGGKKMRNQLTVHAFDDCGAPEITFDSIVVRNGGGQVVNGNGIVDVEDGQVTILTSSSGWSVEMTATASDSSGNAQTTNYAADLLKCKP